MGGIVGAVGSGISSLGGGNSVMGQIGGGISNIGGGVFGSGQNSGMFGLGQFRTDPYSVDASAFAANPAEQQYTQHLQSMAYGQGPSPAQLQMQQGLQQATAQSQALAASQRGISPALAARYAAQNQAGMSQNVAQNSGIMRAQEQMNSMGQLGQELQSQRNAQEGLQNLNSGNFNYAQGLNQQAYSNAAGHRADFMGSIMNSAGMAKGAGMMGAEGGEVPELPDDNSNPGSMNKTPNVASDAPVTNSYNKDSGGGGGGGIMSMLPMLMMAASRGGQVPGYAAGGDVSFDNPASFNQTPQIRSDGPANFNSYNQPDDPKKPKSGVGNFFSSFGKKAGTGGGLGASGGNMPSAMAKGGMVQKFGFGGMANQFGNFDNHLFQNFAQQQPAQPADPNAKQPLQTRSAPQGFQVGKQGQMASTIPQPQAPQMPTPIPGMGLGRGAFPGMFGMGSFEGGGTVPGRAEVKGNSLKNDKVPAMLSPKEIVLPRTVTLAPDAPEKARAFVAAIMARNGKLPGKKAS